MRKCPICGSKLHYTDYSDYPYEEYFYGCNKCGYGENTWCGCYSIGLDDEYCSKDSIHWSYNTRIKPHEYRRFKKQMWSYRKMLLRNRKIKGRGNMKAL